MVRERNKSEFGAPFLDLNNRVSVILTIELNTCVTHFAYSFECSVEVFLKVSAYAVKLNTNREFLREKLWVARRHSLVTLAALALFAFAFFIFALHVFAFFVAFFVALTRALTLALVFATLFALTRALTWALFFALTWARLLASSACALAI